MTVPDQAELGRLIGQLSDGTISPEDLGRLEGLLLGNPEVRSFYAAYVALEEDLLALGTPKEGAPRPVPAPAPVSAPAPVRARGRWRPVVGVLLVLAASVLLMFLFRPQPKPDGGPDPTPISARLAEVQGEVEVVSPDGNRQRGRVGQTLESGQVISTGGEDSAAVVAFPDGVRLELYADSRLSLEKEGATQLSRGFVRAAVPDRTVNQPFILGTPHARLRLSGARGSVSVQGKRTWVEVMAGRVEMMRDGEAVPVAPGSYVAIPAHQSPIVRPLAAQLTQPRHELKTAGIALTFIADRPLLACADTRQVTFWDPLTGKQQFTFPPSREKLRGLAVSASGRLLAVGARKAEFLAVWDLEKRQVQARAAHDGTPRALVFVPKHGLVATSLPMTRKKGVVVLWDARNGARRRTIESEDGEVMALSASPDGKELAGGTSEGWLIVWDPTTGAEKDRFRASRRGIQALTRTPDGRLLASAGRDGAVKVWAPGKREPVHSFATPSGPDVLSLAFAGDNRTLAAGLRDRRVLVWDVLRRGEPMTVQHGGDLRGNFGLALSPDGRTLATGTSRGPVKVWELPALP